MGGRVRVANVPKLVHQVVEGAPVVLDYVAGDCGKAHGNRRYFGYVMDQLSRVRIGIGADFIGLGFEKSPDLCMEFREVLCGPFDLHANTRKPFFRSEVKLVTHGEYPKVKEKPSTRARAYPL